MSSTSTHGLILYRDLVRELLAKEFKVRYKSTVLGYVWSLLNPLAFTLIYYFVFSQLGRQEVPGMPYALFLVTGLFPWQWFQNSVTAANGFFLGNAALIKKVRFPRFLLVLTGVLNDLIHFLVSIPVIALFMLLVGKHPSWSWIWQLPVLVLVQLAMTFGLALVVATTNLFFRDLERLVGIFMLMWFFLTPIVYPATLIPPERQWVLRVNPVTPLVDCWRAVLVEGRLPLGPLAASMLVGLCFTALGTLAYRRAQWRFAEIV